MSTSEFGKILTLIWERRTIGFTESTQGHNKTICFCLQSLAAAESAPEEKTVARITPREVVIPFEPMRRILGELLSIDLETATRGV
ncbi:MAG: hypothetical protein O2856_15075 [Planctomycetota bacterium]|nr:hypothetical protein [Planctomycetota bacterium]